MVFSLVEKEAMHEKLRATMLSENKPPIPRACPLSSDKEQISQKEQKNWVSTHDTPGSLPAANNLRIRNFLCQTPFYLFSHPQLISLS